LMPVSTTGLGDIQNQLLRKHFFLTRIVFEPTKCWGETTEGGWGILLWVIKVALWCQMFSRAGCQR
jgi:hypothetical protein